MGSLNLTANGRVADPTERSKVVADQSGCIASQMMRIELQPCGSSQPAYPQGRFLCRGNTITGSADRG
jgi:hypothetical protein